MPPEVEGPEAAEGTAAHWVFAELIAERMPAVGSIAPNGVAIDQEMIDGAHLFVGHIAETIGPTWRADILVESPVSAARLIHPDCRGTPDVRMRPAWILANQKIHTFDYKYGHGYVEVAENPQLIEYTAGEIEELGDSALCMDVEFHIVQPRWYGKGGPIRSWSEHAVGLSYLIVAAKHAEIEAARTDAPTKSGPTQCRDCRARVTCDTVWRSVGAAMSYAGGNVPFDVSPHQLGRQLQMVQRHMAMLTLMQTGLLAEGEAMIRNGKSVTGYQLDRHTPRERWNRPVAEVIEACQMMGVNVAKAPEAITPAQARNRGVDAAVIAAYSERPIGELRLVPIDYSQTKKVFGRAQTE